MEKKRSLYTERKYDEERREKKKARGDSNSSHTVVLVKGKYGNFMKVPTRSTTVSHGTSIVSACISETEKLKKIPKRNVQSELDHITADVLPDTGCQHAGWEIAGKLEFLVQDPVGRTQVDRIIACIEDFAVISKRGYRVDVLNSLSVILDFLVEGLAKFPNFRNQIILLLKNADKPILLLESSDVVKYFEIVRHYLLYLGYLLIRLEDDGLFDLLSRGLIWQLTAPNSVRGHGIKLGCALAAAAPVLYQTAARMLAVASPHRFSTFLDLAFVLACDSKDICIEMIKENILDNVLARFNPYYPDTLPDFENKIFDRHDKNVPRGQSSIYMTTTISLLLVVLNTLKTYLKENPKNREDIPTPNPHAQRCFIFAYRCECHAERRHTNIALTVIAHILLDCYGDHLIAFSTTLMSDIISLSVLTELPPRADWTQTVTFGGVLAAVHFKKVLLYFTVDLLKVYTYNHYIVESQHWLQGLVCLLDPNRNSSLVSWPTPLYEELRKVALQVLFIVLPHLPRKLSIPYTGNITSSMMCQMQEYNRSPYDITNLYWCTRLLQVSTYVSLQDDPSTEANEQLDETLINLCKTILKQRHPPMKRSLEIVSLCLRILARIFVSDSLSCTSKPTAQLESIYSFALAMLDTILDLLENHFLISDRWVISTLALIWEALKLSPSYRDMFVASSGVYKLLDIITLRKPDVQCVCLAMLCDVAVASRGVAQFVTWRAKPCAADVTPNVVRSGATIMTLLASIFRDECLTTGVKLSDHGVIENLRNPLLSNLAKESLKELKEGKGKETDCVSAADLCGSRVPKIYCLLQCLSEDLEFKVSVADDAYKLYKNVNVSPQDEVILVLCSHYLTLKLNETWSEMVIKMPEIMTQDAKILEEFLQLNEAWGKEIKNQQKKVLQRDQEKASKEEASLYRFLRRVRLQDALDAARDIRCIARTSNRECYTYAKMQNTVRAQARVRAVEAETGVKVIRTYTPPLDERNTIGQYVRVHTGDCVCELCLCNKKKSSK